MNKELANMKIKETDALSIQIEFETPEEKERILTFVNSLEFG